MLDVLTGEMDASGLFPYASRYYRDGAASLHYVDEGTGPPLLLLAGSPMWAFMYRRVVAAFADRHRCIAVDLPGLGRSMTPLVPGGAFAQNANTFQALVRSLDVRRAVLVVHATAGPPGLEMAVRERHRFAGLVISNSFAWPLSEFPAVARFVRIVSSRPFAALNVHANLLPRLSARFARRTGRFSADERAAILEPYRRREARRHLQNLLVGLRVESAFFAALERRLDALRDLPTLFLYGAHDHGYQAGFPDRWRRLLPSHRFVTMPESAHFPLEDEPDLFVSSLSAWLDDHVVGHGT